MSKGRIELKKTFNAGKLAKELPKIINNFVEKYSVKAAENTRKAIMKGVSPNITETTTNIRKKRGQPVSKPLFASGNLFRSIKSKKKNKGASIEMNRYGIEHHRGFVTSSRSMIPNKTVPERPFITPSKKFEGFLLRDLRNAIKKAFKK
tara:strand:- start:1081 stop:1527 length:447 start_codon:yes stop_codon:yes gene_type:complete